MPTHYRYQKVISNGQYTKVIRGMTKAEVEQKAAVQHGVWQRQAAKQQTRWQAQVARQAAQDQLRAMEAQAQAEAEDAEARLDALHQLLVRGLRAGKPFRWEDLKDHKQYPPFGFQETFPSYEQVARRLGVPTPSPLEGLFSSKRKKREELESQARVQFENERASYEARKASAYRAYGEQRVNWERGRDKHNASLDVRQQAFVQGDPEVVTWVLDRVLSNLTMPEDFGKDFDLAFDPNSGTAIVNLQLPTLDELPRVTSYKFIKVRKAIEPVEMKQKDFDAMYDSVLYQICLLVIHRLFREATSPAIQAVVFNGWVTGVDKKTGNDFTSCVVSVHAPRETFQSFNLERVDPKECVRSLKGLVAGPLAQLAPVKPIMDLNREDARFIESREVLANLSATDNLAAMDWEDFEHLVRELFAKEFGSEGSEVRVTQASRDH